MGSRDNHASQQSQNQVSDYHISNVVNDRLKQVSENNGGKDIYLTQTLLTLAPLGLKFSNSDSFLDLVRKSISHAENTQNVSVTNRNPVHGAVQAKGVIDAEKFKASNFGALSLTIGSWKEVPNREGALVAKFQYAKKQLVWEIMEESLKSKIEIRWIDIAGIRASIVANEHGILEVELGTRPTFFQESDPEPRKHTQWKPSQDFTNGQALIHRIHHLEFPPRVLEKHYGKLLQSDSRLLQLSQTFFPNIPCPYFPSVSYNGNGSNIAGPGPSSQLVQAHNQIHQPCLSTGINSTVFFDSNENGSNIAGPGPGWQPVQADNQIHQPCLSIKDQTGINFDVIFLDSDGNGSNIAGPGPDWEPVQAHDQIHQPCFSIKDPTVMDSLPQVVSNQLVVNNPGMAGNIWNQPLSTAFGETQAMGYQIQPSVSTVFRDTQIMGHQIHPSNSTGFTDTQITQVMGYQIQPPYSTDTQVMGYQIDQNNVSAPCDYREGAGGLMMYEEPQCIYNQNNYMQCDDGAGPNQNNYMQCDDGAGPNQNNYMQCDDGAGPGPGPDYREGAGGLMMYEEPQCIYNQNNYMQCDDGAGPGPGVQ